MFNLLSRVTLSSWDEAWYGVISRNILESGDWFNLWFNGRGFYDHPPFVFWLQAISIKIFGETEFAVRLPSFILGVATLVVLVMLSNKLFGKLTGVFAALALITSPWFLTRSLTGNLDIPLTFLFVATFYLAIKLSDSSRKTELGYLILYSISLGFLFLTKSLIPFTILPVSFFLLRKKINVKNFVILILTFSTLVLPWFLINIFNNPQFIGRYLSIGYPGASAQSNILENILLTKMYLHNGLGNWFWWGFLSMSFGFLFYRKKYISVLIFVATFLIPFAFSNKGHIWHLIPLHPFWTMSFFGLIELANKNNKWTKLVLMVILFVVISFGQIKREWYEILLANPYKSDISILSLHARNYELPLYLDDDSLPESVFYSGKTKVERIFRKGHLKEIFEGADQVLVITKMWRLEEEGVKQSQFSILLQDRDKLLIIKI